MVKERYPELDSLSLEDKWMLLAELEDEVMATDASAQDPLKSDIVTLLEERYRNYLIDPDSARSWSEVSKQMRQGL